MAPSCERTWMKSSPITESTTGSTVFRKTNSGSTTKLNRTSKSFFIDHLLVENRLIAKGMSYDDALEAADKAEMTERRKAGDVEKLTKGGKSP